MRDLEKYSDLKKMRDSGATFKECAEYFKITTSKARRDFKIAEKNELILLHSKNPEKYEAPFDRLELLSVRVACCLRSDGIYSEEKAKEWVDGGCVPKIPNMGPKQINELRKWLGLDVAVPKENNIQIYPLNQSVNIGSCSVTARVTAGGFKELVFENGGDPVFVVGDDAIKAVISLAGKLVKKV